jgi:serine/threonine-protein kinase
MNVEVQRSPSKARLGGVVPGQTAKPAAVVPKEIGRYQVVSVVGRGAMGVVYKARDPLLDRTVALKTINPPAGLGERVRRGYLERFEREAKAAARLSHPAIVTIFDVGLALESPFLVMEYLPGETLADRLDRGRMPLGEAVECARELASALASAHRERIVHRDVKPANVLIAGDNRWKLADFGIVRLPDSDLTQAGTFMGTPGYAPPEAIRDGKYTAQADVFAWGALFYELLCGVIPYEGPDTATTNKKVMAAEPPSPRKWDPKIPEPLAEVVVRALAHDPARRFADGAAALEALGVAWQQSLASGEVPLSAFMPVFSSSMAGAPASAPRAPSPPRREDPQTVPDQPSAELVAATHPGAGLPRPEGPAPARPPRPMRVELVRYGVAMLVAAIITWFLARL